VFGRSATRRVGTSKSVERLVLPFLPAIPDHEQGDRDAHDPAFPSGGFEVDPGTSGSQPIGQQKGAKRQREHGNGQAEGYQGPDLTMHVRLKQMEKKLLRSQKELLLLQQHPPPQQQQQVSFTCDPGLHQAELWTAVWTLRPLD
jgi:hypothetical protein